nr:hypothetical protein [Deltaproteobacteria bacterium]
APDWSGVIPVRACALAGPPLPDGDADLRPRIGTATRDDLAATAVLVSPDGWALAPASLAEKGIVTITVGDRSAEAKAVRTDRSLGLALYKLPGEDWPCLLLGATAPSAGAKVYAPLADKLASASVIGVQAAGSFKFLRTNLPAPTTGLPLLDATSQLRAIVSSVVSLGGMAGTPLGLPAPTLLDRLDIVLGPTSESDPDARVGVRGTSAVIPTVDVDDPAPEAP